MNNNEAGFEPVHEQSIENPHNPNVTLNWDDPNVIQNHK